MPIVAPSGGGNSPAIPRNNGGAAIGTGGKGSDSKITRSIDVFQFADDVGADIGARIIQKNGTGASTTDRYGVSGIRPSSALPYNASATEWIMQGVTTTIAGAANNVILFTGSDYDGNYYDHIHQLLSTRAYGSGISASFNYLARSNGTIQPNFVKGSGAGALVRYVAPSGNGTNPATDDAASPSRSVPGELTYRFGGALPRRDVYKSKDSFES